MNMEYVKPSYDHSIVSLLSLLKATFNGSENTLPSSHCLNNEKYLNKLKDAQHIILLIIDGLGYNYVAKHPEFHTLNGNLLGCMESVFPTSTAPAITSFFTGNTPYEHGVCGWFQWFPRYGIMESTEIIENGWLGPTQASRSQLLPHVLGDYTLIMKAQYTLSDVIPGENDPPFIGMHGGLSDDERLIPCIWLDADRL